MSDRTIWTLAAVMTPEGPCAVVREGQADSSPDLRVMAWQAFDKGERKRFDKCSRSACRPGKACDRHQRDAAWWWFEWSRREERDKRREALAFEATVDGVRHRFKPRLPDDEDSKYWGSVTRWRG